MQSIDEIAGMLELMDHPAFCVTGGTITAANQAARDRLVPVNEPVLPLISDPVSYREFESGTLELTITVCGSPCRAAVTRIGCHDIFRMYPQELQPQLQTLALAAQELRRPLSELMTVYREFFSDAKPLDPAAQLQAANMNRELYRMLRIIGNMSFQPVPHMEMRDVTAVLGELFESAVHYCEQAGRRLTFANLPVPVFSYLDSDLMNRAVYNLLSNAIRHTPPDGLITARLRRSGNTLLLTIQDSGDGSDSRIHANAFHRLQREPGIGSGSQGLGLGLTIVEAVARAHGGTVMMDQPRDSGVKVVMSLPIRQDGSLFRSPKIQIDYTGELSRELIELSDVLPASLYTPGNE